MKTSRPFENKQDILTIKKLKTHFHSFDGIAKAVNNISFTVGKGETLGIVGESGSGKSVTALSVMGLITPPGRVVSGSIHYKNQDLTRLSEKKMQGIRGNKISMIFQEPMTSLNPLLKIGRQISEVFIRHQNMGTKESMEKAIHMLEKVQIPSPAKRALEYPHQISGGMRQRVMIAMAMACNPAILIADEPTTALDVTIQAQVMDLMLRLKDEHQTSILMITHDLGVIAQMAQRVIVMYAGQIMESASVMEIFDHPVHPYTIGLLQSSPRLGIRSKQGRIRLKEIKGTVPSLYKLPDGCSFYPRCPKAMKECSTRDIPIIDAGSGHMVRCLLANQTKK